MEIKEFFEVFSELFSEPLVGVPLYIMIVGFICFFVEAVIPLNPILNGICLIFSTIIPGIYIGILLGGQLMPVTVLGWIFNIVLAIGGCYARIRTTTEDVREEVIEDGKKRVVYSSAHILGGIITFCAFVRVVSGIASLFV